MVENQFLTKINMALQNDNVADIFDQE